jgi:hypothetical protein
MFKLLTSEKIFYSSICLNNKKWMDLTLKNIAISILSLALMLGSHGAKADNLVSIGTQFGTLGGGFNLGYAFNNQIEVLANINGLNLNHTFGYKTINYESPIRLRTAGLLAHYHPFDNGLYLSGGVYYNGNNVSGNGYFTENFSVPYAHHMVQVDGNQYGHMSFQVQYSHLSPYIGLGYQTNHDKKGWSFSADVGVMYQGNAKVSYNYPAIFNTLAPNDIQMNKNEIQKQANKFRWYPVAEVGVSYQF